MEFKRQVALKAGETVAIPYNSTSVFGEEVEQNFSVVLNISELIGANAFAIAPGHELRKATDTEIKIIQEVLRPAVGPLGLFPWEGKQVEGKFEMVPKSDWRYHVVCFEGTNETIQDLEEAFLLTWSDVRISFTITKSPWGTGRVWHAGRLLQQLQQTGQETFFRSFDEADSKEVSAVLEQIRKHDPALIDIKRLARQLLDLEAVPHASSLRFLGYFAVLEALITHAPKPLDPYDSIRRQVWTKLSLLNHRFARPLDYSSFNETAESVWKKMYDYRSKLAHGGDADFDGDLRLLKDSGNAFSLLRQATKATFRQSLIEPQLIFDLHHC